MNITETFFEIRETGLALSDVRIRGTVIKLAGTSTEIDQESEYLGEMTYGKSTFKLGGNMVYLISGAGLPSYPFGRKI